MPKITLNVSPEDLQRSMNAIDYSWNSLQNRISKITHTRIKSDRKKDAKALENLYGQLKNYRNLFASKGLL